MWWNTIQIILKVEGEEGYAKLELSDEHMDNDNYVELEILGVAYIVDISELYQAALAFKEKQNMQLKCEQMRK